MERMEQLIRESLQARAQDVEPTPALWLEVDRRVARRRRFQVLSWSLAGAAAVVAAVLAVPAVIGLFDGPEQIEIPPLDRTPTAGVVPELYVADVDGRLEIHDLTTGEIVTIPAVEASGPSEAVAREVEVRPGSTREAYAVLAVRGGDGETPATLELLDAGETEADADGMRLGPSYGSIVLAPSAADPGFRASTVWAPDRDAAAITVPTPEADGSNLVLWESPSGDQFSGDLPLVELGVVLGDQAELLDWVGTTAAVGDESVLFLRQEGLVVAQTLLRTDDGFDPVDSRVLDGVLDVASSHSNPGTVASADYLLRDDADGLELVWAADGDRSTTTSLEDVLGDAARTSLWVDARQDAALVGDGDRTYLIVHDGAGRFLAPVELDTSGRAALFDTPRRGTVDPAPDPTADPVPTDDPTTPDADTGTSIEGATLPAPIVTASLRELTLHGPSGPQVIAELAAEGESAFLSARVRPGSTLDDLTVVALTTAEGMWDLRTIRWVDGELTVFAPFEDGFEPGFMSTGPGLEVRGPVWSPDGASLAWLDTASGVTTLRTVGWGGDGPGTGDPATDNASFEIDTRGQQLRPVEWVATPDAAAATELRFAALDSNEGWYALPVDVQGDGAVALSTDTVEVRTGPSGGGVVGLASDDVASPRWLVQTTFDGVVLWETGVPAGTARSRSLPDDLLPGDGLVELWVRAIGDAALVGSPHTSTGYLVTADRDADGVAYELFRLPGDVVEADVVR